MIRIVLPEATWRFYTQISRLCHLRSMRSLSDSISPRKGPGQCVTGLSHRPVPGSSFAGCSRAAARHPTSSIPAVTPMVTCPTCVSYACTWASLPAANQTKHTFIKLRGRTMWWWWPPMETGTYTATPIIQVKAAMIIWGPLLSRHQPTDRIQRVCRGPCTLLTAGRQLRWGGGTKIQFGILRSDGR